MKPSAHVDCKSDGFADVKTLVLNFIKSTHRSIYLLRMGRLDLRRYLSSSFGTSSLPLIQGDSQYDKYAFRDFTSELLECAKKFKMLHQIVESTIKVQIDILELLDYVYEQATLFFAKNYEKYLGGRERVDQRVLYEGLAHGIKDVREYETPSFVAIGEATCYCMFKGWTPDDFNHAYSQVMQEVSVIQAQFELQEFKKTLLKPETEEEVANKVFSIESSDYLTGAEFERFVGSLLVADGYSVFYTNSGADQGVDLVAQKDGIRIAVQAKRYAGRVGNSSVQEVVAGKLHYHCDKAMVITNSYFTKSAISLATSNEVLLWDRDLLESRIQRSLGTERVKKTELLQF